MSPLLSILSVASCVSGNTNCQDTGLPWLAVIVIALLLAGLVVFLNITAKRK